MSKSQKYYQKDAKSVLGEFGVSLDKGLSDKEVADRQEKYGFNQLTEGRKRSALKLFLGQFKDVLIIVLIAAATVSLGLGIFEEHGSITEALLIYAIVIAIAVVGFLNEYKAEKTVEALRKLVSATARVRRGGQVMDINVDQIVPGDIVLLDEGKKVPADIRLASANRLQVNEASLTGESVPVSKHTQTLNQDLALGDQRNMLFSGTIVTTGTAEGVVVGTGSNTEIGQIATLVSEVHEESTPMQKKLDALGKRIGLVVLGVCVLVFLVVLFLDQDLQTVTLVQRLLLAFTAAVALAVAAIPEGLAFVVRISLALGARRMASKKALVRKLSAVESLGSTDVVCSDKTGTLTRGEMTVRQVYAGGQSFALSGSGYNASGQLFQNDKQVQPNADVKVLCEIGMMCNNARVRAEQVLGDPTEGSLIISAAKVGITAKDIERHGPRIVEVPFSSERKRMSTLHQTADGFTSAVKGAPDVLISLCTHILKDGKVRPLTNEDRQQIVQQNSAMAGEALRVLAFAYRDFKTRPTEEEMEQSLVFAGLQGMMDPPRTEVKQVILDVQREAGMRVVMITGDNIETAKAVATEIGISGEALSGVELDKMDDKQFRQVVEKIGVYARVDPKHKIRIVEALKAHGHQVAMTGDGVNDAPAIKAADIGIAMGITGTDAAKEASDMILLDDQFVTIIAAIKEGRAIFDNVRKFVNFLLSCNIAEVLAVLVGLMLHGNLILSAVQILFINIVTDGLPAVALGSDPASKHVMQRKPGYYQQSIITTRIWVEIAIFAVFMSALLIAQYAFNLDQYGAAVASSVVFMGMVVYEFVRLVDIRSSYKISWLTNPLLWISIIASLLLQLAIIYITPLANLFGVQPFPAINWAILAVGSIVLFVLMHLTNPLEKLFEKHH